MLNILVAQLTPAAATDPLILQLGFAGKDCMGAKIPQTVARSGICGPMSSTFSARFAANETDVHVDIYNSTSCAGDVYESRDEPVGGCISGAFKYEYPAQSLPGACVLWGHTQPGCPDGQAMSGTVAQTTGRCLKTEGFSVDQSFAVAAGGGKYNITTSQFDAHFGDCYPMFSLPLIQEGSCLPLTNWYAPYAKLVCDDSMLSSVLS